MGKMKIDTRKVRKSNHK